MDKFRLALELITIQAKRNRLDHSMRVGAAQDLFNSGATMPIIMQRGRWSKTDTVMRYVEHL